MPIYSRKSKLMSIESENLLILCLYTQGTILGIYVAIDFFQKIKPELILNLKQNLFPQQRFEWRERFYLRLIDFDLF